MLKSFFWQANVSSLQVYSSQKVQYSRNNRYCQDYSSVGEGNFQVLQDGLYRLSSQGFCDIGPTSKALCVIQNNSNDIQ